MVTVEHDGSPHQHWGRSDVTGLRISPGINKVGRCAFARTALTSVSGLRDSSVTCISGSAFRLTSVTSLRGSLPPALQYVGAQAFGRCPLLADVVGLPPGAVVHPTAFDGCPLLQEAAEAARFASIAAWLQHRRAVAAQRVALLLCVGEAIDREDRHFLPDAPAAPLLVNLSRLPEVLWREIAGYLHYSATPPPSEALAMDAAGLEEIVKVRVGVSPPSPACPRATLLLCVAAAAGQTHRAFLPSEPASPLAVNLARLPRGLLLEVLGFACGQALENNK